MPKAEPSRIEKSGLILGEGIDEVEFLGALLKHLGLGDVDVFEGLVESVAENRAGLDSHDNEGDGGLKLSKR